MNNVIIRKTAASRIVTILAAIAASVILPQIFHAIGAVSGTGAALGSALLPMHIPVILAGFIGGPVAGAIAGILSPLASFAISSMPAAAILPYMVIELGVYGFVAGIMPKVKFKDIIVMEPVKGGTLANVPKKAEKLLKSYEPDMTVPSWAIRFAASCENVFMVLSGMSNTEQLLDNTGYMENFKPLTEEEKAVCLRVADIINSTVTIPCTVCRYCVDECPMNIPIPDFFSLFNADEQEIEKPFTVQGEYYDNLAEKHNKASACIECKNCEAKCPQHIDISKFIKLVAEKFETE